MAKKKRILTEAQRLAKNAQARERTRLAKEAGFTREEYRSIQKTIKNAPELLKEPTRALYEFVGFVNKAVDWVISDEEPKPIEKPKKAPTKRKNKVVTPGIRNEPKKGVKKLPYDQSIDLLVYITRNNPDWSISKIIRETRAGGGKLKTREATDIIHELRGTERKIKYYTPEERKPFGGQKMLIKDRYMYLMAFDVELDNGTTNQDFVYIAVPVKKTRAELADMVLDYWEDVQGTTDVRKIEKYVNVNLIPESIFLVFAVDRGY